MSSPRAPSHAERGITFVELLIVIFLLLILATVAVTYSLAWLRIEELRSAVYQTQSLIQLARVESVTRNRACAFALNTTTGRIQVKDLNGTVSTADDTTLADVTISSRVLFESPDGNPPLTITDLTGSNWGAAFASDGSVASGSGVITLRGDSRYNRISLYGAGGSRVERWEQGAWRTGS